MSNEFEIQIFAPTSKAEELLAQFARVVAAASGTMNHDWPYPARADVNGRTLCIFSRFADAEGMEFFHRAVNQIVLPKTDDIAVEKPLVLDWGTGKLIAYQNSGWSVLMNPPGL